MSRSKAVMGLSNFLETWGRKLKNEPKPELPRRTIEEEAKIFEERNKELAEAIRIRESLARGEPLKEADYYRSVDKVGEKLNIPQPEAEAFLKEYYNGDPRLYLSEYYSKKYPKGSSVVNGNVKTPNTEPLSAPLKNEPPKPEAPNNTTEAVIPEAETVNATARATTEVPKDPSKAGLLLKNILSGAGTGSKNLSKALLKGAYDNHALYGAYVGGAGGAGYTFTNKNEDPNYLDYLKNAALGAALGAGAFAVPSVTFRALSKSGSSPTTGSMIRTGFKYGVVPTAVGMGEPIYNYTKNAFNSVVPEKPSQSNSLQMFTPEQALANTNGGALVGTNQQDTSESNRKPKGFTIDRSNKD